VRQFWANPVLSREDNLNRWETIVRSSDKKLVVFLSADQVQKLQGIRKEQGGNLKQFDVEQREKPAESE